MSVRKKKPSAADVLRQEMQQPLVLPDRTASPLENREHNSSPPNPTPTNITNMNQPNSNDAAAANQAQLKQQIEDLQSKLKAQTSESQKLQTKAESLTKELKDAKETVVKLAAQGKAPAKSTAIAKVDSAAARSSITARPVQTSEETAIRRANTDIGWLD
jgi:vacuolar-type H+-ATPase subunit I/STV1